MRRWFLMLSLLVGACGEDPQTAPADVQITFDIQPIDRGVVEDQSPTDRAMTDLPRVDTAPMRCAVGSFEPCECAPGFLGTRACLDGGISAECRCAGFDASVGDGSTLPDAVSPADVRPAMDAAAD